MFRNNKWMKINTGIATVTLIFISYLFYTNISKEAFHQTLVKCEAANSGDISVEKDNINTGTNVAPKSDVETITVTTSTYTEKGALKNVEWKFLKSDSLSLNGAQGTFEEYLVSSGDLVMKGDPILSYQVPYDEIAIEEMKLTLELNESAYKKESKQKNESIEEQQKKLQLMDGKSVEAQILAFSIDKLEIEYEQYQRQTEKSLKDLRTAIEEQEANMETQYILAPYDGVVLINDKIEAGKVLNPYEELAYIYDTKSAVLGTTVSGADKFWYGLEVSVTGISNMKEDKTNIHKGKVVAVDSLLNGKASTGMIYIAMEEENLFTTMQRGNITAQTVSIEGVLVIPAKVVKAEDDMTYVYILDQNNEVRKQYITGRDNGTDMWVYSGLSEGQRIVVE